MFHVFRCCNQWKKAKIVAFHMVTAFTVLCWSFMHKHVCFFGLVARLFKFDNTCKYPSNHGTIGLSLRIIWLIFTFVWILEDYWWGFLPDSYIIMFFSGKWNLLHEIGLQVDFHMNYRLNMVSEKTRHNWRERQGFDQRFKPIHLPKLLGVLLALPVSC